MQNFIVFTIVQKLCLNFENVMSHLDSKMGNIFFTHPAFFQVFVFNARMHVILCSLMFLYYWKELIRLIVEYFNVERHRVKYRAHDESQATKVLRRIVNPPSGVS